MITSPNTKRVAQALAVQRVSGSSPNLRVGVGRQGDGVRRSGNWRPGKINPRRRGMPAIILPRPIARRKAADSQRARVCATRFLQFRSCPVEKGPTPVIPAKAGIQSLDSPSPKICGVDSCFRGNDDGPRLAKRNPHMDLARYRPTS